MRQALESRGMMEAHHLRPPLQQRPEQMLDELEAGNLVCCDHLTICLCLRRALCLSAVDAIRPPD